MIAPFPRDAVLPASAFFVLSWLPAAALAVDSIVVFNEIQYHPAAAEPGGDDSALEFIELYNQNTVDVDLSGWRLSGGADFAFPEGTVVPGRGFLVVAADPGALEVADGALVLGPLEGRLDNAGDTLRLRNRNERIMDEMSYDDEQPWPAAADGSGATLAKADPMTPSGDPGFWRASPQVGGTPGAANFPEAGAPPPTTIVPLLAVDAPWRFNESGADLGADWATREHGEGGDWGSGAGPFVYETSFGEPVGTELTRPGNNDPFVLTYYFEREFTLTAAQLATLESLQVRHLVDDGAVIHLNGEEVLRFNMPGGPIGFDTLAASGGEAAWEGPVGISPAALVAGTNRISVQVHQSALGSSDVVFGLALDREQRLPDPNAAPLLRFNELAPGDGGGASPWWLELANRGPSSLDLEGVTIAVGVDQVVKHVLPATVLEPGGFLVVDSDDLGVVPAEGTRLFLHSSDGVVLDGAVAGARLRGRVDSDDDPDGEFLVPSAATPGEANVFALRDEIVINEIMFHHRPRYAEAGTPPTEQARTVVAFDAPWRFNESGIDPGADWHRFTHPVGGGWQTGAGAFGYETNPDGLPAALGTILTRPGSNDPYVVSYFFETEFEMSAAEIGGMAGLEVTHAVDDGAVFYLNGVEVGRFNMPAGAIGASTLAASGGEAELATFPVDPARLVAGTNRLSVQVHQSALGSSDVVMAVKLDAIGLVPSENPEVPFAEIDEEWIELHNRSDHPVDLSGWSFDDGLRFEFPDGTQLEPGGFLVVSNDAAALAAKFPGARVLGDFGGTLSNEGERIRLVDAAGNPADEVHYRDDKPWPVYADGSGSSLELRDPDADNSVPEAWADSDNAASSEWRRYTFRATAQNPRFSPTIYNFHELRLGLIDRGELLLDDVSVIEDPDGANRQLMQNGGFSSGSDAWRLLGTHQLSEVVDVDGGSPALHVVASARMNYMNNLLETSLKSGGSLVPVRPGTEYEISFRAKWLGGSPQFRWELYYNKAAGLVVLDQPETHGTPGAPNSTLVANLGPTFREVRHEPAVPSPDEIITVRGVVSDPDGVAEAVLHYSTGGDFESTPMRRAGSGGEWEGTIPGQSSGRIVQFYLEAVDGAAEPAASWFPAAGPESRALVKVDDGRASDRLQNLRIVMTSRDSSALHRANDILNNHRFGCTVISNEREIFYDCGIRLRGSMFSRRDASGTGLNIKFPANRLFRGLHGTITTRTSGRREIIAKHMINHAGGIHDNYNDAVHLMHATQNGVPSRLSMSRFGGPYMDGLPDGEGTVFKMEGIREFQGTTTGNPESPKTPFPIGWRPEFDLAGQGDDKEIYRHNMRINSNYAEDDYASIIAMCQAFDLNGSALDDVIPEVINVDAWMRQFALLSLLGVGDTYTQGNPHNFNLFVRPTDGRVEPMPWDWDFLFNRGATAPLWGNRNFAKIPARPIFGRLFHGHLLDLIKTTCNAEYMTPWLAHYGQMMGEGYTGYAGDIRNRANYVLGRLPSEVPFAITSNSGGDFAVDEPRVTLRGDGWIDVREIRVGGVPEPLEVRWTDADSWEVSVPLTPGANAISLTAIDHQGNAVGSDTITVTNTGTFAPAGPDNLVVGEIHYHPADDAPLEFIELVNISDTATVDLSGVAFGAGIDFTFPDGTTVAPGARVLVVQDRAAFEGRFGAGLPVIGEFAGGTRLANDGERIRIAGIGGVAIRDFTFGDDHPWPEDADGGGWSLVLVDPASNPDHADPASWRTSVAADGSPGDTDAVRFTGDPGLDTDGDEVLDFVEFALGSDLDDPVSLPEFGGAREGGGGFFEFTRRLAAEGVTITPEVSDDLVEWRSGSDHAVVRGRANLGDGNEGVVVEPLTGRFVRLRVELAE